MPAMRPTRSPGPMRWSRLTLKTRRIFLSSWTGRERVRHRGLVPGRGGERGQRADGGGFYLGGTGVVGDGVDEGGGDVGGGVALFE